MKKTLIITAIVGVAVLALGVAGFSYAQSQNPRDFISGVNSWGTDFNQRPAEVGPAIAPMSPDEGGPIHEYLLPALADGLGLTSEELQARLEAGDTIWSIAEEQEMTLSEFRTMVETARTEAVNAALEDGLITQEQADRLLDLAEKMPPFPVLGLRKGFGRRGSHPGGFPPVVGGLLKDYMQPAVAEALGLSVEELQERHEAGETSWDIAQEQGLSEEEFKDLMDSARINAINAALEDGKITQEQADWMLDHPGLRGLRCPPIGPRFPRGPRGPFGGAAPGE